MSGHTYRNGLDYSGQIIGNVARIVGMATLAAYAWAILSFVSGHFQPLMEAERTSIANIGALVSHPFTPGAGSSSASVVISGGFIVFCLLCATYLTVVAYKWIQQIVSVWEQVGSCNWWDSFSSFFHCLGDALWGVVQTLVWVLVTYTSIVVVTVNIAGLISLA